MIDTKFCCNCEKEYPRTSEYFYRNKKSKDRLSYRCKNCADEYSEEWKRKNREKFLNFHRSRNLKENFNISIDDWQEIFQKQNGRCAICDRHQSEFNIRFAVDHNHKTGAVRGLLCMSCNRNLGWFEKNKNKAEKYVKKYD